MAITLDGTTGITAPGVTDTGNLSVTGTSTSASFIPSGATVPANGIYLSAANTLNLATNTTNQVSISSTGIVTGTAGNLMLVQGTAQASTSGTSIDFTGIPSWVKRITVTLNGVSTSGTSNLWVQIGSGSVTSSGYTGYYSRQGAAGTGYTALASSFILYNAVLASSTLIGSLTLVLISGTTWVGTGITIDSTSINSMGNISGSLALSGALDRIRLTTANGTDTFDAGTINIQYE